MKNSKPKRRRSRLIRLTACISEADGDYIRRVARALGVSAGWIVRNAVHLWINKDKTPEPKPGVGNPGRPE